MSRSDTTSKGLSSSLSGLPKDLWSGLLATAQPVVLTKRQSLFMTGDEGEGCYVVQDGALKAVVLSSEGHERMLTVFGKNDIVGEMALFDGRPRSATVVAIEDSKLAYVSHEAFFRFADAHPEVYRHALRIMAGRLRGTTEDALAQSASSVAARVAKALLQLSARLGQPAENGRQHIAQRVTQSDIAAMAGVARENASRVLNRWLREKVISRSGSHYVIDKPRVLEEMTDL